MKTRVSAYALAIDQDHILLTQLAPQCRRAGHWTLPGGGIKHGEQPGDTVIREAYEEAGLLASDLEIFHAYTFSESERGLFLGVQIIYRARMVGEPRVIEVGGSTADARWVHLAETSKMPIVPMLQSVLMQLESRR